MQEQKIRTNQFTFYLHDQENLLEKNRKVQKGKLFCKKSEDLVGRKCWMKQEQKTKLSKKNKGNRQNGKLQ